MAKVMKSTDSSSLAEVVDRILDKGIVIDAWVEGVAGRHRAPVDRGSRRDRVGRDVSEVCRGHRPDLVRRRSCLIRHLSGDFLRDGASPTVFLKVRVNVSPISLGSINTEVRTHWRVRSVPGLSLLTLRTWHPGQPRSCPVMLGRDWPGDRLQNTRSDTTIERSIEWASCLMI